ncbi:Enoyl-CoA hydratase/carnithine racemase [Microbacterium sp. cf046]|uniref:enoyl-CoA hydratase/isomerase family protein n=1 Tax=Microbacterium sp. cf046 TaxID=1761803 RepID=UPI0008E6311D|nr:enoyl-CoA hydratase/isomerase family protein [Microbacterium sp. cf046]SFS16807.1 Enoyl-CoA hydratase/carnithine racemase [Microbacterium sp. cf046]
MTEQVTIERVDHTATVEIHKPPANFFDRSLLADIADALLQLDTEPNVRAIVLCAEGRHFCAGADLRGVDAQELRDVYREAFAIFTARKPIVAAVQGAAVGGGLGLALAADFRVATPESRLSANFARLGFHQGFGLSVTMPRLIGAQRASELLYTGRAVVGEDALAIGLVDRMVPADDLRAAAQAFADEIAQSAPLSLLAIRSTLRRELVADISAALDLEATAQTALLGSADFAEGVAAAIAKRDPHFTG